MLDRAIRALSKQEKIAIALSKSISATFSFIASSIIIYKIHLRYKSQPKSTVVSNTVRSSNKDGKITTYHRMLFSISVLDVIHSTSSAFSTLLVPSYTNGTFARGTTETCTVQGMLQQLTVTIVIYMAALNTYFMFKIRYNIADSVIKRKYEVWLHAIPLMHFVITAIVGLSLRIFGPILLTELGCWLDSYCIVTNTCTRSGPIFYEHFDWWPWSFSYIWLFLCVLVVSVNSVLIYTAIRTQERRNEQYFAAKLIQHSEANFTRSVSHPSGSSAFDKSGSHFFSEAKIPRLNDQNEFVYDQDVETHDDTPRPRTPLTEEAKVELTQIDETEETSSSCEQQLATKQVIGDNNGIADDHQRYWDGNDTPVIPTILSTSLNQQSERGHDRMLQLQQQKLHHHNRMKNSRVAAVQGTLYITSALFTAFWIFMPWLAYKLQLPTTWRFFFALMVNIASPSQGVFNLFLFVRIQYARLRETNPNWNRWKCVKTCLFSSSD